MHLLSTHGAQCWRASNANSERALRGVGAPEHIAMIAGNPNKDWEELPGNLIII